MLALAMRAGVDVVDTAPAYGTSEEVLGLCMRGDDFYRIVTKTPHFNRAKIVQSDAERLETTLHESLQHLGRDAIHGLLLHNCEDCLAEGGERLLERMAQLVQRGLVQKFGVSAYSPEQVERVLDRYPITLVQFPFNVLDQRFERSGTLTRLKLRGVEVHSRSVFLQGALLLEPDDLPPGLSKHQTVFQRFHASAGAQRTTKLRVALSFALAQPMIDRVVVGACNSAQLGEILAAASNPIPSWGELRDLASEDESLIHPGTWS
jgi:aryl-alcohol dehydrogenase-like predicted oxidoreductase